MKSMKLYPIQTKTIQHISTQNSNIVQKDNQQTNPSVVNLNNIPHYVCFKGSSDDEYSKAKKYLDYKKSTLSKTKQENLSLQYFDVDRLEGIQKGIKVFDGLSFRQVVFVLER